MSTTTANANEGNTLRSAATIAAGGSATHDLDLNDDATIGGAASVAIQFDLTDSGSAVINANLYASVDSGSTFDNVRLPGSFQTEANGSQKIKTVVVDARVAPYLRIELVNQDGASATGNCAIKYAATKWDTA